MKELFLSVSNFQMECPKISKDSNNPFFSDAKRKVNYASLPHILSIITPILKKNGLLIVQPVVNNCVVTKLIHIETGQILESVYDIVCKDSTNAQQIGSGVSYARRYSLTSILNLNIDDESDDDGNSASANNNISPGYTKATRPPHKESLNPNHPNWTKAKEHLQNGGLMEDIERKYSISAENKKLLIALK
jgi:hypothetical protein